jgi:hypothetical protein
MSMWTEYGDQAMASDVDPQNPHKIRRLTQKATSDASDMAKAHYPYAVIEDTDELRSFAGKHCKLMWTGLEFYDNCEHMYPEVERIYVGVFMNVYREKVEESRREKIQKELFADATGVDKDKARIVLRQCETNGNGTTYGVAFIEFAHMKEPIHFKIFVGDNEVVELREY